jgi:SAM-dependent methyltransferase
VTSVIWHDLECGPYVEDLPVWRSLAAEAGDPVLDVGAGTGRVSLDLARRGHRVTALDRDPELIEELARRADGLDVETIVADARDFDLARQFALCLVPMQTIQLLGGSTGRTAFLRSGARHLRDGALLVVAISEALDAYEISDGIPAPFPDICERDGIVYSSQPTAVRVHGERFVIERRRETVTLAGERSVEDDAISLDRVTAEDIEREGESVGLAKAGRLAIPETEDYTGSTVVMLRA